jgi:hypothetical protein
VIAPAHGVVVTVCGQGADVASDLGSVQTSEGEESSSSSLVVGARESSAAICVFLAVGTLDSSLSLGEEGKGEERSSDEEFVHFLFNN